VGNGTPIGRVRGLGAAHAGPRHWFHQRVTAAGNLLLMTWFLVSLARLPSLDHQNIVLWLSTPFTAVPLVLLTLSVFYHLRLGLQVIIEDYVTESVKLTLTLLANAYVIGAVTLCLFSILKIGFGGVKA
jgi:succinate dehydrogenase / fumarate reductase membrane anchor subunit